VLDGGPAVLRDVAMANFFGFLYTGCTLAPPLANAIEPSMFGGDAALCRITFTTCYYKKDALSDSFSCRETKNEWSK